MIEFVKQHLFWGHVLTFSIQDLLSAMKSLGLSPTEQEVVDMQNEVEKKGRIFFPDFCKLCLRKFREFDDEDFRQELFKVDFSDLNFI